MPTYTIRFDPHDRNTWVPVTVPADVRGIERVADYIARKMGRDFARAKDAKNIEGTAQNWYDGHLDFIRGELQSLADATRRELRIGRR